jgi:uncharacterized protein (DUF2267 family)
MDQKQLARTVADRSGLSREESADIARAVLEGLAGQLSEGEVRRLAASLPVLPEEAQAPRRRKQGSQPISLHDFIGQVSERTALTRDDTRAGTGAVIAVLRQVLSADDYRHLMAQLPAEYGGLPRSGR